MIVLGAPLREAPLTRAQAAILLAQLRAPASSAYHEPFVITLTGPLDRAALREALRSLLLRHEILRTCYRMGAVGDTEVSDAVQVVRELASVDLAPGSGEDWEGLVAEPFDLARQAPLRLALRRIGRDRHELLVVRHHIATDGWSLAILLRDLASGYRVVREGGPQPPPLPLQYADLAVEERSAANVSGAERDLEWWRARLADETLAVALPGPTGQPVGPPSYEVSVDVPADVAARVRACARARAGTEFSWLLTAVAVAVATWVPSGPVPVGVAVAGRDDPAVAELVGCFSSVLPVLVDVDPGRPVQAAVARAGASVAEALSHPAVDPSALAAQFGAPHVVLAYQSLPPVDTTPTADLAVGLRALQPPEAKFPVSVTITPRPRGCWQVQVRSVRAQVADQVCDRVAADVAALLRALPALAGEALVNAVPTGPYARPGRLPPPVEPPVTAHTLGATVALRAAENPDRIAASEACRQVSYRGLVRRAQRLASSLGATIRPETPVVCWLSPGPDLVAAQLAVLLCGGSFVPQDRRTPWSVVADVLHRAAAPVVLLDGPVPGLLPDGVLVLDVTRPDPAPTGRTWQTRSCARPQHPDQIAYLIYTSGSTGGPKGVQVPHRGVLELVEDTADLLGDAPGPRRWSCVHSPAFDFSIWEIWAPLVRGEQVVFIPPELSADPARLATRLDSERVDVLSQTPAALARLVARSGDWSRPGTVILGGEAFHPRQGDDWFAQGGRRLVNLLGITEVTVHGTAQVLTGPWAGPASMSPVGRLLPRRDARIVSRFGRPAPPLAAGELWFSGSGLARGYAGRPDLTAAAFVPAWWGPAGGRAYRSGDLVAHLPDGGLDYRHRLDQQLSLRGQRIEPGQVRAALLAERSVRDAVVAVSGSGDTAFLAAWLVAADAAPDLPRLRRRLVELLPPYLVPAAFMLVDELPTTVNGKVDPSRLPPAPLGAGLAAGGEPVTATQARLLELWSQLIGLAGTADTVAAGLDDRFVDLGAHSLIMLRLADAVARVYGVEFTLAELYGIPTLRDLAAEVEDRIVAEGGRPADLEALVELLAGRQDGADA